MAVRVASILCSDATWKRLAFSLSSSPESAPALSTGTTSTPSLPGATQTARLSRFARDIIRSLSPWLDAFFAGAVVLTCTALARHANRASDDSTLLDWKRAVLDRDAGCVVYHDCEGALVCHHVVTQQHLRKRGLDVAWDRRIGVTVCERAHRRHHSARERIPMDSLPSEVVEFVTGLGLDWYLAKYYPQDVVEPADLLEALDPGRARIHNHGAAYRQGYIP